MQSNLRFCLKLRGEHGGKNSTFAARLSPESCPIALATTTLDKMK